MVVISPTKLELLGQNIEFYGKGAVMEWRQNKWVMMTNNMLNSRWKFIYGMDVATSGAVMQWRQNK
eukprot:scaffold93529_cov62-Attheya_sp.AAC.3